MKGDYPAKCVWIRAVAGCHCPQERKGQWHRLTAVEEAGLIYISYRAVLLWMTRDSRYKHFIEQQVDPSQTNIVKVNFKLQSIFQIKEDKVMELLMKRVRHCTTGTKLTKREKRENFYSCLAKQ